MSKRITISPRMGGVTRAFLLASAAALALPAFADPSNKWRIEFDGKADRSGEIELSLTPVNGTPVSVVVPVADDTRENRVAQRVRDALATKFGSVYHVEVDDGEDVLVKAEGGTPDFEVAVVRNTVDGIDIELDRE